MAQSENLLISVFEALAQSEEATTECLLVAAALLKAIAQDRPDLMERYHRFHDEDASVSPIAVASRQRVARLRGIVQVLKQGQQQG